MKKSLLVSLFFLVFSLNSQSLHYNSYIDIPSAEHQNGLFLNLNSNHPLKGESEIGIDPNLGIEYTFNKFNAALKWYDRADFAFDFSFQLLKEKDNKPSIAIGFWELTYNKFLSPAGSENTYKDEAYTDRPPEIASLYAVATKNLSNNFQLNFGVGRGKFVGYGPRSSNLNTDFFTEEKHENFVFGLFGGASFNLNNTYYLILEADGRDANVGIQYKNKGIKAMLSLNKLELLAKDSDSELASRINFNLAYKIRSFEKTVKEKKKKNISVTIEIIDKLTREPVKGVILITTQKGNIIDVLSDESTYSVSLKPGIYMVRISSDAYKDKKITVTVKEDTRNLHRIELEEK